MQNEGADPAPSFCDGPRASSSTSHRPARATLRFTGRRDATP